MKNITDYFSNSDKDSPNKDLTKDTNKRNSDTSRAIDGKTDMMKIKTNEKRKKNNSFNTHILSKNDSVDQNHIILQTNSSVINHSDLKRDDTRYSENSGDETKSEVKSNKKNAFQIMMESRNKIIGSNSPGKDFILSDTINEYNSAKKNARKKLLSEWADLKGCAKRKREEEEKGEIVKKKLEKRSKRMKKLLHVNKDISESSNDSGDLNITSKKIRKKKLRKLSCSSNSSVEDFGKQKNEIFFFIKSYDSCGKKSTKKIGESNRTSIDKIINDDSEGIIFVDENDRDLLNKGIKKIKETDSTLNDSSKAKKEISNNNKNNKILNTIIADESSQESLSTPPALRSWRMRIKLNITENDVQAVGENINEEKVSVVDLDEDSQGEFIY